MWDKLSHKFGVNESLPSGIKRPKSLSSSSEKSGDVQGAWGASPTSEKGLGDHPDTARTEYASKYTNKEFENLNLAELKSRLK